MKNFASWFAAVGLLSLVGCGSSGNETAQFGMKVVVTPAGESPSAWCSAKGSSVGGGSSLPVSDNLTIDSVISDDGGTIYDITVRGTQGSKSWRYDQSMARANQTLSDTMQDGSRSITVTLVGSFANTTTCTP